MYLVYLVRIGIINTIIYKYKVINYTFIVMLIAKIDEYNI